MQFYLVFGYFYFKENKILMTEWEDSLFQITGYMFRLCYSLRVAYLSPSFCLIWLLEWHYLHVPSYITSDIDNTVDIWDGAVTSLIFVVDNSPTDEISWILINYEFKSVETYLNFILMAHLTISLINWQRMLYFDRENRTIKNVCWK